MRLPADIAGWRTAWLDASTPLRVLVAGAGDVRHVLCTIARARRQHAPKGAALRPIHIYVVITPLLDNLHQGVRPCCWCLQSCRQNTEYTPSSSGQDYSDANGPRWATRGGSSSSTRRSTSRGTFLRSNFVCAMSTPAWMYMFGPHRGPVVGACSRVDRIRNTHRARRQDANGPRWATRGTFPRFVDGGRVNAAMV